MKNIRLIYSLSVVFTIIIRFSGYINGNMHLFTQKNMRNNPFFDANTPLSSQKMRGVCSMMYFLFFVYFAKLLRDTADFLREIRWGGCVIRHGGKELFTDAVRFFNGVVIDFTNHGKDRVKSGDGVIPELLRGIPDSGSFGIGCRKNFIRLFLCRG